MLFFKKKKKLQNLTKIFSFFFLFMCELSQPASEKNTKLKQKKNYIFKIYKKTLNVVTKYKQNKIYKIRLYLTTGLVVTYSKFSPNSPSKFLFF